ncbi:DUF982 domain-containing protein [Mesorhizobium sp. ES1-3]|uniref:DUF982 domain-containing protein n=1 Tax=Mesorhizobium sp. ES1-3 TaxID=2876628 RepID=UPI001CCDE528|nr:DUF982 domain-containing protein [Mesorhizobium sp. ES1-3]MBZ9673647.1 DUF982 domain-containing protein [Mesorhizobium sp. ES1-3]
MYEAWFSRPVPVATGISGEIINLSNANQAVDVPTKHCRSAGSRMYLAALRARRHAMNGGIAADVARDACRCGPRSAHAHRISPHRAIFRTRLEREHAMSGASDGDR